MKTQNILKFLSICFIFGYSIFCASIFAFSKEATYSSELAYYFWVAMRLFFFIGIGTIWAVLNMAIFKDKPAAAHILSAIIYIYCILVGGVFAGVGM
ncbi:MAG: hypothetical protein PHO83_06300 [Geobacteraceae bacterium]|nr:hypothetical protein [Geobacteraceae bacterium]